MKNENIKLPAASIQEAIVLAFQLLEIKELTTHELAARNGYKTTNSGRFPRILAAGKFYGLIVSPRRGVLAVSEEFKKNQAISLKKKEELKRIYEPFIEKEKEGSEELYEAFEKIAMSPAVKKDAIKAFEKNKSILFAQEDENFGVEEVQKEGKIPNSKNFVLELAGISISIKTNEAIDELDIEYSEKKLEKFLEEIRNSILSQRP